MFNILSKGMRKKGQGGTSRLLGDVEHTVWLQNILGFWHSMVFKRYKSEDFFFSLLEAACVGCINSQGGLIGKSGRIKHSFRGCYRSLR